MSERRSAVFGLILMLAGTASAAGPAREETMSSVVDGSNAFALDLYARLRDKPGNLFFSPSSISTALAMTYAGARGDTAGQMARVLHFGDDRAALDRGYRALLEATRPAGDRPGFRLSVANRLWGQKDFRFLPDFLALTRDAYHAELGVVDFAAEPEPSRERINAWIEEQTEGKIKELLGTGTIDRLTRLVLTNAIYFKGDWAEPFKRDFTKEEPFHVTGDKTTRAPMMHKVHEFRTGAADGLKFVELPYGRGDLSAVVLLADQVDGLPAVEARLSAASLDRWLTVGAMRQVDLALPRFKVESEFSLADTLAAMGMPLAFDRRKADFSGMSSEDELHISAVVHKAYVDLNEEGTEAAAATGVVMTLRAMARPAPPVVFHADHPFLFLIRDNRTKAVLFLGRVVNPAA
ncbi:Serpin (serine protease inhibitor) [Aquisphaera giovannonii]|uniref:Serpin (Serine protease inhibitor) n=1 Tax=Aquisphaera giovannonii TaxID=406548 RepID=A0A5B9W8U3_9BACT|nr:serpin family protein [Aquisphaera giovannonii]QEH36340.1 Serpin (serine protease inhibitor) [Aquisphaera giovannonii]